MPGEQASLSGSAGSGQVASLSALSPLVATNLIHSYGDRTVLSGVDLLASPGEPVGLVGENGVGKSTMLRLLAGVEVADAGSVRRPADLGYLAQEFVVPSGASVASVLGAVLAPLHAAVRRLEELAHRLDDPVVADAYAQTLAWAEHHDAWDADRRALLAGQRLGLEAVDPTRLVATLSGGERTRLAMAAIITRRPECVVLDEPTNHLDDGAMAFLEETLRAAAGVVVVASHDRVFLESVCDVIVDLDDSYFGVDGHGGNRFGGGFANYLRHKESARQRWEQAFADQQGELHALRTALKTTTRTVAHNRPPSDGDRNIYNFKGGNVQATISRRVRNVEQRIALIEQDRVPKPPARLRFQQTLSRAAAASAAVSVRDVTVAGRLRLDRFDLAAGEHVLVTGTNGSGKSTLLSLIAGRLTADSGTVHASCRSVAMLPQQIAFDQPNLTAYQVYDSATGSSVPLCDLGLLHPVELAKPVGLLSVGQQRRLAIAIVIAQRPELLLLDEPTNHISLVLASELEEALGCSTGAVMVASHDRWLRRRWRGRTLTLHPAPRP